MAHRILKSKTRRTRPKVCLLILQNSTFWRKAPLHPVVKLLADLAEGVPGHLAPVLKHTGLEGADIRMALT